ncbi:M14 family zinc carboxypeptidase [Flavobacterium sp.]|uniref:M14 family zinc carboxypeptidase n=1 Tax=Flavobacterium sp. TaxID=239 RepID=UPI0039E46298
MKKMLLAVLLLPFFGIAQNNTEKYHRAKIIYRTAENLKKLETAGLAMDHGIHKIGYSLVSDFSDSEIQAARNLGIPVEIEIEDIQHYYANQHAVSKSTALNPQNTICGSGTIDYTTPFNFQLGSMSGYYTYDEMLEQLDAMHAARPDLITARADVGDFLTSEGRALQWVKITQNPESINSRPQVLYTAVHHAREPISLSETIFYMWYLLENYDTNEEVKYIVDNTELYFIPVVNPDGYVYNCTTEPDGGGMWRKNRRNFGSNYGVDNNRNYDYWIGGNAAQSVWNTLGVSPDASGETFPGTAAFSEPETQAVRFFVDNHHFKLALNAHTFSDLLLYPFGYDLDVPSPDDAYFRKISALMVSNNDLNNHIASALYAASGSSDDFMYGQTMNHDKIFAFTPEIGQWFWPATTDIIPLSNKMMFTNLITARLALNYAKLTDTSSEYLGNTAIVNPTFELARYGLGGNGNFTVSINPVSSNIIAVGTAFQIDGMAILEVANSSISLQLAPGTSSGDLVVFEYLIDNGAYIDRQLVTKKFGQVANIFSDNGSAVGPTWTTGGWGTTTEAFVSAPSSITDSPLATYGNNQSKNIRLTNQINLTAVSGATATFSAKWDLEKGYDYTVFEVMPINGNTWIPQCGKYTRIVGETPAYSGTQSDWVNEEISLSEYAGQIIRVRFRLISDFEVDYDGFYFDDFKVNTLQNSVLSVSHEQVSAFGIYPNPAQDWLHVNTAKADYTVKIFNLLGQLVVSKPKHNGSQSLDVSQLEAGVYLIEMQSGDFTQTQRFLKK